MISKTQRWLDLIAFLVKHRFPVAVDQIMEAVPAYEPKWAGGDDTDRASVRRMFERDKDELRALGIPLETVTYSVEYGSEEAEGYRLSSRDFYMPYLRIIGHTAPDGSGAGSAAAAARPEARGAGEVELPREHAAAAVDALQRVAEVPGFGFRDEARSALRKVAFDLDVDRLGGAPVLHVTRPDAEAQRERVAELADAVRDRKKVRFRYHGLYRGEPTDRDVAPYGLLFQHGHWYLIGHDDLRDDRRTFRLERMEAVEVNASAPKAPDYEVPDEFDLSDYAGREPWELGGDDDAGLRARVRFAFPAALWVERAGHGHPVESLPDGAAVRAFDVHQVGPFLRWLQGFAGEAVVESPAELRQAQVELARRTAALYADDAGG